MGTGSKIDVHTVLKLMAEAMIPTKASSGASSGSGNSSTWIDLRGSFSADSSPANISCSSALTSAPRTVAGSGSASISSPDAPERIAARMASISVVMTLELTGR